MAKITLIGMYNYDQTLFDLLTLPTGIDKSTLVDNILIRSGEFEVLYPDMDYLKFSIGAWSRKWRPTFDRWQKALEIEYNPLENYDRTEEWTDNRDVSGTDNETSSGSETNDITGNDTSDQSESRSDSGSGNEKENTSGSASSKELQVGSSSGSTSGTTSSTTDTDKSAYDSATLVNVEELRVSGADASHNSATTSMSISNLKLDSIVVSRIKSEMSSGSTTLKVSRAHVENLTNALSAMKDLTHKLDDDLTHKGRIRGNIGVTTSQQMLKSELDLGYWNIYEKITDLFLTEFIIPIY